MPLAPRASRISSITTRYSRASSCACSLTSSGSGCSVTAMRNAPPTPSPWPWPSSARCSARMVTPRWPPGSIAGWPSSSATTPIGENWPLRRVAMTTRGGPSRRQCVIDGGARLVTGDRDRDRHVREDHAVVEREEGKDRGADVCAHVEDANAPRRRAHSLLTRTCVRSTSNTCSLRPISAAAPRRSPRSSASSRWRCSRCPGRLRARARPASTSSCPARRCGASRAPPTAATRDSHVEAIARASHLAQRADRARPAPGAAMSALQRAARRRRRGQRALDGQARRARPRRCARGERRHATTATSPASSAVRCRSSRPCRRRCRRPRARFAARGCTRSTGGGEVTDGRAVLRVAG